MAGAVEAALRSVWKANDEDAPGADIRGLLLPLVASLSPSRGVGPTPTATAKRPDRVGVGGREGPALRGPAIVLGPEPPRAGDDDP